MNFHRRHPHSEFRNKDDHREGTRQFVKVFQNVRSRHGSPLFHRGSESRSRRLRLGLGRKRNCGLDCCCHRHSVENFVVHPSNLFRFYELLQLATSRGLPVGFPRDAALTDAQQDRRHQHQCTGWRSRESSSPDA